MEVAKEVFEIKRCSTLQRSFPLYAPDGTVVGNDTLYAGIILSIIGTSGNRE